MTESGKVRALHLQALGRMLLLLAIPILVGLGTWLFGVDAERASGWVRHTLQVEVALERLQASVETAESNQRDFLLTGEPMFLNGFGRAEQVARGELSKLSALTADNPSQQQHLARLRPILDRRFADWSAAMEAARSGKESPPSEKGVVLAEESATDEIQAQVSGLFQEEERLLALREQNLRRTTRRFAVARFVGFGLLVLVVGSLYRNVRRYGIESEEAKARLSGLNSELEERVEQRTALLHAREELLSIFVQYVPAAVAMLDREMRYLQMSDRWCAEFGLDRAQTVGMSHYELFPNLPERWLAFHRRCLEGETLGANEDRWDHDSTVTWLRWEIRPWGAKDGKPEGILIFAENITAQKTVEQALRESEATIRTLLVTASQAILAVDAHGRIVMANRMVGEMFGYAEGELIGKSHDVLIPARLRERHGEERAAFMEDPKPRAMGIGLDLVGVRKDGTEIPIEVSLSSVQTKQELLAVSFVSDISARKQAETDLRASERKLRDLAASLLRAQEAERSRLARELHDDVTQHLAFLSIELGKLIRDLPPAMVEARGRVHNLQRQTLRASNEVRRLSHGLHPSVISHFGLSDALEEFCEEFQTAHGIRVDFEGLEDEVPWSAEKATCLYRIAQESMRNAVVHGRASVVRVQLRRVRGNVELRVEDNGAGFVVDAPREKKGLGIVSMTERVRMVGGRLELASQPGQGTAVMAAVPVTEGSYDEKQGVIG